MAETAGQYQLRLRRMTDDELNAERTRVAVYPVRSAHVFEETIRRSARVEREVDRTKTERRRRI
jgi:hypothetical protein